MVDMGCETRSTILEMYRPKISFICLETDIIINRNVPNSLHSSSFTAILSEKYCIRWDGVKEDARRGKIKGKQLVDS